MLMAATVMVFAIKMSSRNARQRESQNANIETNSEINIGGGGKNQANNSDMKEIETNDTITVTPDFENNISSAIIKHNQTLAVKLVSRTNFYQPIYDRSILQLQKEYDTPPKVAVDKNGEAVPGAIGWVTFEFIPLKKGQTTIELKNAHDLSDADSTITVNVLIEE
jgi:hypothetical protein